MVLNILIFFCFQWLSINANKQSRVVISIHSQTTRIGSSAPLKVHFIDLPLLHFARLGSKPYFSPFDFSFFPPYPLSLSPPSLPLSFFLILQRLYSSFSPRHSLTFTAASNCMIHMNYGQQPKSVLETYIGNTFSSQEPFFYSFFFFRSGVDCSLGVSSWPTLAIATSACMTFHERLTDNPNSSHTLSSYSTLY